MRYVLSIVTVIVIAGKDAASNHEHLLRLARDGVHRVLNSCESVNTVSLP